jgi:NAD+ kinase
MVISIGGDGTFLKAAGRVGRKNIPILGSTPGDWAFWQMYPRRNGRDFQ